MPQPGPRRHITVRASRWGLALWIGLAATVAVAQPERLPPDVLTAESSLSDQQNEQVEAYVSEWADVMAGSEEPARIAQARKKLLAPLNNQLSTELIKNAVGRAAAAAIRPAMERDSQVARLNALIVAASLSTGDVAPMCIAGLKSDNPAVRYWAAKAIAEVAGRGPANDSLFTDEQQKNLLAALTNSMSEETSDVAVEQMARALSGLTIPAARQALLDVLDERLGLYRQQIREGLRADAQAISDLRNQLAIMTANEQQIAESLRRLVVVSAKYLQVVTNALQQGQVPERLTSVCVALVESVENVFSLAIDHFGVNLNGDSPPLVRPAQQGQYNLLALNTLEWVGDEAGTGILSESAIDAPRDQLRLPEVLGAEQGQGQGGQGNGGDGDSGDGDSNG